MQQQRWGDYVLWDQLNEGGMAEVFKATSPQEKQVVVRRLKSEYKLNLFKRYEFTRGLDIQAQMDHPSIIKVFEMHTLQAVPYAVLEFIDGFNLRQKFAHEGASLENRIAILLQILEGLHHIHSRKYLHLDFKPENILISNKGDVKIFDFDLAEKIQPTAQAPKEIHGTPAYIAPEQILRQPVDERTDIFALGLTAFELFVGQKAFTAKDRNEIFQFYGDLETPFPTPRSVNSSVPHVIDRIISRCLAKKIDDRFPNVSMILRELDGVRTTH
jgi:eukaryotic-like serine/threonine-protein kinase